MNAKEMSESIRSKLEAEIEELDTQLQELEDKRSSICEQLKTLDKQQNMERVKAWGLRNGSKLICFGKTPDYHWTMIKCIHILDVQSRYESIETLVSSYKEDDGEYSFRITWEKMHFAALSHLESEFNIYSVDDDYFDAFHKKLCTLPVNYDNVNTYETECRQHAHISIRVENKVDIIL